MASFVPFKPIDVRLYGGVAATNQEKGREGGTGTGGLHAGFRRVRLSEHRHRAELRTQGDTLGCEREGRRKRGREGRAEGNECVDKAELD